MKIYRVEDDEGLGMYYSPDMRRSETAFAMQTTTRHPLPREDSSIALWYTEHFKKFHRFGFSSLDQLRMWIHAQHLRDNLKEAGLFISIYSPIGGYMPSKADYILGDTQAIFSIDEFECVGRVEWDDL